MAKLSDDEIRILLQYSKKADESCWDDEEDSVDVMSFEEAEEDFVGYANPDRIRSICQEILKLRMDKNE